MSDKESEISKAFVDQTKEMGRLASDKQQWADRAIAAEMALNDYKWLDPECAHEGCQSLVWKGRYESAVKDRREFRQAYVATRSRNKILEDAYKNVLADCERIRSERDRYFGEIERLKAALKPFAGFESAIADADVLNGEVILLWDGKATIRIARDDFRRARAALSGEG